jgi:hypothetical protein
VPRRAGPPVRLEAERLSVNKKLSQADQSNMGAKLKNCRNTFILLRGKTKKPQGRAAGGKPLPVVRQLLPLHRQTFETLGMTRAADSRASLDGQPCDRRCIRYTGW